MKQILIAIAFLLITAPAVSAAAGQYGQYGQYVGGAPSRDIMVDKMVATGQKTKGGQQTFVDNLTPSDPRFTPGTQVTFQVKVKNTSDVTLSNVQVQDILPDYVDAVEGPGDFDPNTRTITWNYAELKSGEEKIERVVAQIKPQAQLPADKGLMCLNNKAVATADNARDEDTAQFCVEKQVVTEQGKAPTTTPEAGAPLLAIGALNLAGLAGGIWLRKRA